MDLCFVKKNVTYFIQVRWFYTILIFVSVSLWKDSVLPSLTIDRSKSCGKDCYRSQIIFLITVMIYKSVERICFTAFSHVFNLIMYLINLTIFWVNISYFLKIIFITHTLSINSHETLLKIVTSKEWFLHFLVVSERSKFRSKNL